MIGLMKWCWLLMLPAIAVTASEFQYRPGSWWSWQRKGCTGSFIVERESAGYPRGYAEFRPAKGSYHLQLYNHIPSDPEKSYECELTVEFSSDADSRAALFLDLGAKDRNKKWLAAKVKKPSLRERVLPGKTRKIKMTYCLSENFGGKAVIAVPQVTVVALNRGTIRIVNMTCRDISAEQRAALRKELPAGFRLGKQLPRSFWPSHAGSPVEQKIIDHMPMNLVWFEPDSRGSGIMWNNGTSLRVKKAEGGFAIAGTGIGSLSVKASRMEMIFHGNGAFLLGDGRKVAEVRCGGALSDAYMLIAEGGREPVCHNAEITGDFFAMRYLEEGERLQRRAEKMLTGNEALIRKTMLKGRSGIFRHWIAMNQIVRDGIAARRKEILAGTGGRLDWVLKMQSVRRYYDFLMASADIFTVVPGYVGDFFRKKFFESCIGQGEYLASVEHFRKVERLICRARRLDGTAFREGQPVFHKGRPVLAAGFADSLETVSQDCSYTGTWNRSWRMELASEEQESFQLILAAGGQPVKKVGWRMVQTAGPGKLPEKLFRVWKMHSIPMIETFSFKLPAEKGGDEFVPDVLEPLQENACIEVPAGKNALLWFTGELPSGTLPGIYSLKLKLTVDGQPGAELPLTMRVFAFNLGKNRLQSSAGVRSGEIDSFYGRETGRKARRNLIRELLKFHMEPTEIYSLSPVPEDMDMPEMKNLSLACAGRYNFLGAPRPEMVNFVRLFASEDGRNFVPEKARVSLVPSGDPETDDYDLVLQPAGSLDKYAFVKIHQGETRDWWHRCLFSYFRLDCSARPVLMDGAAADGKISCYVLDRNPRGNGGRISSERLFQFDSLREDSNFTSVVFAKRRGRPVREIRLVNSNRRIHKAVLLKNYSGLRKHLGPKTGIFVYGYDEVFAHMNQQLLSSLKLVKKLLPEVITVTTAYETWKCPELYQYLDVVCPLNGNLFEGELAARGKLKYWMYNGGGTYYPYPNFERVDAPRIHSRAFFWQMAHHHISGWLYWNIDMWRSNTELPKKWPEIWKKWNPSWGENMNGMGALFYPGPDGQVYPSARIQVMRDGIEDYNYFMLAEELLNRLKQKKLSVQTGKLQEEIDGIRAELSSGGSYFLQDDRMLKQERGRLGSIIEKLTALDR